MSFPSKDKLANVLLVEDSLADITLFTAKMKVANIHFNLRAVRDGEEALEYLLKTCKDKDSIRPDIIFLDINLPKIGGHELLERIKEEHSCQAIPVIMLSGTENDEDIMRAKALGSMHTLMKPLDDNKLAAVIEKINSLKMEKIGEGICLVRQCAA